MCYLFSILLLFYHKICYNAVVNTKALGLVRHAEQVLGFALTERKIGGKGGGGSVLTDEAKEFLYRYEQYRDACKQAGKQLYPQFFPDEK